MKHFLLYQKVWSNPRKSCSSERGSSSRTTKVLGAGNVGGLNPSNTVCSLTSKVSTHALRTSNRSVHLDGRSSSYISTVENVSPYRSIHASRNDEIASSASSR